MAETYAVPAPNQDERVMAALSHLAIIIPYVGLIVPVIIWITQRGKSQYAVLQALQAIAYQVVWLFGWILAMACYMGSIFVTMIGFGAFSSSSNTPGAAGLIAFFPFLIFGVFLLLAFVYVVYGLIGAVMTFMGKPFRYLLIGRFVERYFEQPKAEPAPLRKPS